MIFIQSRSRTLRKHCKRFTSIRGTRYSVFQESPVIMKANGRRSKEVGCQKSGKTSTNKTVDNNNINKSLEKSGVAAKSKKVTTRTTRCISTRSQSRRIEETKHEEKMESTSRIKEPNSIKSRTRKSTVLSNKKRVNISNEMKIKNKTGFRQMSLKESFTNQETLSKRLRPRKESRNYCEDSVLQQNNKKSESKPIDDKTSKVPVYKSVKPNDESLRNRSDIYDFKFDADDSKERLTAKRKRRKYVKTRKTTRAKLKQVPSTIKKKVSSDTKSGNVIKEDDDEKCAQCSSTDTERESKDDAKKESVPLLSTNTVKISKNNTQKESAIPLAAHTGIKSTVQNLEIKDPPSAEVISEEIEETPNIKARPTITSIEYFNNKGVIQKVYTHTPIKSNSETFAPFRKTNIFNNKGSSQCENLINHSLSPIKKISENFDPGSPWRISPMNTFSQVKNVFQSTPQPRAIGILQGRIRRHTKDQEKNVLETSKKSDILETDNENISMHKTSDVSNYITRKLGKSIRKFGTEITNLDHSIPSINNTIITEQQEETTSNGKLGFPDINSQNTIDTMQNDLGTYNDITEDKENAAPKSSKSKKLTKKRSKKVSSTSSFPLQKDKSIQGKENLNVRSEVMNIQVSTSNATHIGKEKVKENQSKFENNFDSQAGPSGLQKLESSGDKPLQQKNLNAQSELVSIQKFVPSSMHVEKEEEKGELNKFESNFDPQPGPSGLHKLKSSSDYESLQPSDLNAQLELVNKEVKLNKSESNFDPQPGPSGLQKFKSSSGRLLKQTNLNAFLNITEMPQSTTISTAHGIFNDAHSTPITGKSIKSIKQVGTEHMTINNAFGFEEECSDSDLDISPIYHDPENKGLQNKKVKKMNGPQTRQKSALPVRLLPQEIKKNIAQRDVDTSENNVKTTDKEGAEARKETLQSEDDKLVDKLIDSIHFSDTFDVLGENDKTKVELSAIPLFTDPEPSHFIEPPKRLYKRKRNVKFSFSESEDDEELSDKDKPIKKKKKKYGNLKKEDVKRMEEWIKNINNTFQEIDHYELVVE